MNDEPVGYTQLRAATPLDQLHRALANAVTWSIVIGVNAAVPLIIGLWRWAL